MALPKHGFRPSRHEYPSWFLRGFFKGELAAPYTRLFVEERHFYCERWNEQEEEHLSIDKGDGTCLSRYGCSWAVLLEAISMSVILLNWLFPAQYRNHCLWLLINAYCCKHCLLRFIGPLESFRTFPHNVHCRSG